MVKVIIFTVGILIGIIITIIWFRKHIAGSLRVDQSDPDDQPYLFLEMEKKLSEVLKKKYVILKVNIQNYISQK